MPNPVDNSAGLRSLWRRSFSRRLWCDENLPNELVQTLWRGDVDRLLYSSTPLQVKDRCIVGRIDHPAGPLLIKQHTWGGFGRTLRSSLRKASAPHCGRIALKLHQHGIATPLPRAWLEHRFGPFGYRSYLLTEYVPGTSLYRLIRFGSPTVGELRRLARQVAEIWQRLVEVGISHNDMKPENFIVDEQFKVWLIDFEKVRSAGAAWRQRQRHVDDVKNFLHIRGWHHQPQARRLFLSEFLNTPYGCWLAETAVTDLDEFDAALSVLILCDGGAADSAVSQQQRAKAIQSVCDIADEILLVTSGNDAAFETIERVQPCEWKGGSADWTLVIHENETVTPFLAKQLQHQITRQSAPDALRVVIEPQCFGRTVAIPSDEVAPIRLFRGDRYSISISGGNITVAADHPCTAQLAGTIQRCTNPSVADLIKQLNEQTSSAALQQMHAGRRPRLFRAILRSITRFFNSYFAQREIRNGWIGLQRSLLESFFVWIEETKLYQVAAEFVHHDADAAADLQTPASNLRLCAPTGDIAAEVKAA